MRTRIPSERIVLDYTPATRFGAELEYAAQRAKGPPAHDFLGQCIGNIWSKDVYIVKPLSNEGDPASSR